MELSSWLPGSTDGLWSHVLTYMSHGGATWALTARIISAILNLIHPLLIRNPIPSTSPPARGHMTFFFLVFLRRIRKILPSTVYIQSIQLNPFWKLIPFHFTYSHILIQKKKVFFMIGVLSLNCIKNSQIFPLIWLKQWI